MQVVDRQQQRSARGDVRRQPVQAMQRGQRGVRDRLGRELRGVEQRRRGRRRSHQELAPLLRRNRREQRLEQLAHDPIRERALKLRPPRAEHLQPGLLGKRFRLRDQRGLPDPRGTLDRQQPAGALSRADQRLDDGQLGVALE